MALTVGRAVGVQRHTQQQQQQTQLSSGVIHDVVEYLVEPT